MALTAAGIAGALLSACTPARKDAANTGPFIGATVVSFTPGEAPARFETNASVAVLDASTGDPIATATVTVNGSALAYDGFEYVGSVAVAPGDTVSLAVAVAGHVYGTSVAQFGAYPQVQSPAAGDVWAAYSEHGVSWTPGAPTPGAAYLRARRSRRGRTGRRGALARVQRPTGGSDRRHVLRGSGRCGERR
jgi:hypothetical protein